MQNHQFTAVETKAKGEVVDSRQLNRKLFLLHIKEAICNLIFLLPSDRPVAITLTIVFTWGKILNYINKASQCLIWYDLFAGGVH